LSYLEKLRIKADKDIKGLLETMDTREIYQHCTKAMNPTKLETVLANLGIPYRYLHNAGNDALYTMRALIALAVQQRQRSRKRAAGLDAPK
jgi:DNA polymerase III epsilon subunit-like protein